VTNDDFLSRWSRRKHAARRGEAEPVAPVPATAAAAASSPAPASEAAPEQAELPPVESLTPESDFQPFMQEGVDPGLRRQALRTLFRDPRFNVMDGLDVYIDDFSKPDPIPPEWLGQLNQMAHLGDFTARKEEQEAAAAAAAAATQPTEPGIDVANQEVAGAEPLEAGVQGTTQAPDPELKES
jgi:hypothetical protein